MFGIVGAGAQKRERLGECEGAGNGLCARGGGGGGGRGGGERDDEEPPGVDPDLMGEVSMTDGRAGGARRGGGHTRWSAISGFSHFGSTLAASMSRNSPSAS